MSEPASPSVAFDSAYHPDEMGAALVYLRALAVPLAWAFTMLMIGGAASVLLNQDPLRLMMWLVPLAMVGASGWTGLSLRRQPARLTLRPGEGALQSVWEAARNEAPAFKSLARPRRQDGRLLLPLGRSVVALDPDEWPTFDQIVEALEAFAGEPEEGNGDIPLKSASLDPFRSAMP